MPRTASEGDGASVLSGAEAGDRKPTAKRKGHGTAPRTRARLVYRTCLRYVIFLKTFLIALLMKTEKT